jgi:hypothetical protein
MHDDDDDDDDKYIQNLVGKSEGKRESGRYFGVDGWGGM